MENTRPTTPPQGDMETSVGESWQTVTRQRRTSTASRTSVASRHEPPAHGKPSYTGQTRKDFGRKGATGGRMLKMTQYLSSPGRQSPNVSGAKALAKGKPPSARAISDALMKAARSVHAPRSTTKTTASGMFSALDSTVRDEVLFEDDEELSSHDFSESDEDEEGDDPSPEAFDAPVLVICPFPHPDSRIQGDGEREEDDDAACAFTKPRPLVDHLAVKHGIKFRNLHHMYFSLQAYLDDWSRESDIAGIEGVQSEHHRHFGPSVSFLIVDPDRCEKDDGLRHRLQREKLEEILVVQDRERHTDAKRARRCLFCRQVPDDRAQLFRHMFVSHGFNIGLPDNLVHVDEFLNVLQTKLNARQCVYCEKTFTNAVVLRRHMRKKKHFKIAPHNRRYDRYYVVNYLEPGKNWEDFEAEAKMDDDGGDGKPDDFEDWDEPDVEPTPCLFCAEAPSSPEACLEHMKSMHGFDLFAIKKDRNLDFYKTVTLINFVRHHAAHLRCYACAANQPDTKPAEYETQEELVSHMKTEGCFTSIPANEHDMWKDAQYLFPTLENDPLLMVVDPEEGEAEETEEKRKEAVQDIIRKLSFVDVGHEQKSSH